MTFYVSVRVVCNSRNKQEIAVAISLLERVGHIPTKLCILRHSTSFLWHGLFNKNLEVKWRGSSNLLVRITTDVSVF